MRTLFASLAIVLGLLVGAGVIGGATLRGCVRWIDGFTPTYRRCCLVVVLAVLVWLLFGYLLQLVPAVAGLGPTGGPAAKAVEFAVRTTIVAGAVHLLIHRPDGSTVGYPRAFAIAALAVAILTALAWVVLRGLAIAAVQAPGLP